jgi:hypothetical protein
MRLARKSIEDPASANFALRLDIFSSELTEFLPSLFPADGGAVRAALNPKADRFWRPIRCGQARIKAHIVGLGIRRKAVFMRAFDRYC